MSKQILSVTSISSLFFTTIIYAQEIEVTRSVHFGDIAVVDNSSQGYIDIDRLGNISRTHHFHVLKPGHAGELSLTGFAKSAELFINTQILHRNTIPSNESVESFELLRINIQPVVNTRGDGSALISFGGTIASSGSGYTNYAEATYSSKIRISVQY